LPDLEKFIPIVRAGYGWNVYSIYKDGVQIGELKSSFTYDPNAIEFHEIADSSGRLNSDKTFEINSFETGNVTTVHASEITIGDGTFVNAGSVGMWFTFNFDVHFYKASPGDFEAIEIKSPNRIESGKTTPSVVSIRNNSLSSYTGDYAPVIRLSDGYRNFDVKSDFSPGEIKDVSIQWKVPDANDTIEIAVTVNPDKKLEETDYSNNKAVRDVIITAPAATPQPSPIPSPTPVPAMAPLAAPAPGLVDFAITGFRETNYTMMTVSKSYVKIKYTGDDAQYGVTVTFDDGESVIRKQADFLPNTEKEIDFDWLTPQTVGAAQINVSVNPDRTIGESNFSNNSRDFNVNINLPPVDLSVSMITPANYPAGKQVVTLIDVKNFGDRDFTGGDMVEVKLSVPSIMFSMTKRVQIERNSTYSIPFYWTAPGFAGAFDVVAEVNPGRTIDETNYNNNELTLKAETVDNPNPAIGCNDTRREWSERRLVGYNTVTRTAPDGTTRTFSVPVYRTYHFYAEVSLSARLIPDSIKSGYGAECEVTASVRTNYDNPNGVIPLQEVYAYLPTDNYSEAILLEPVPGTTNRWRFPVNPASVIGARVAYIPVSWPDGQAFRIGFTGFDAQSPGGAMCATVYAQTMVDGNMYEDDYTAPLF
jgi:hypothetical protein